MEFQSALFPPETPDQALADFLRLLRGRGWVRARQLRDMIGLDDRQIRGLANASQGAVISGQKGYRLTAEATDEEVQRCCAFLLSQANAMTARRSAILQAAHHGIHG